MAENASRAVTLLTDEERVDIMAAAKTKGMTLAAFLRYAALKLARRLDE